MPKGFQTAPGAGAEIDRYGNMRRGQLVKALSSVGAMAEQGSTSNKSKVNKSRGKRKKERYFVANGARPRTAHIKPGLYQDEGGDTVPILMFVKPARYEKRLDLDEIVAGVVDERLAPSLEAAIEKVLARMAR